jgi:hypothetical protein
MSTPSTLVGVAGGDPANLELTPDDMRQLGEKALARVVVHVADIAAQPARGGLYPAAVADFISAATNRYTGV